MATLDKTGGNSQIPWAGISKPYVLQNEINLAAVATGDVVQALSIKAKTFVENVFVEIITPTGLTSTATVGDGVTANGWDASVNLNAAAGTRTKGDGTAGADPFAIPNGKDYVTADTIDLTCTITGGPIVTGKIKVSAICYDIP